MTGLKVVALAGGTGSAKLLRGLDRLRVDLTVVANVGDNIWMYGAYVCPDVDIACYTLAGISDQARGWGIDGDSLQVVEHLSRLGVPAWFRLGDRDLAVCLFRTGLLRAGYTLTRATSKVCAALGVSKRVLPATDDPVETHIMTPKGELHLQEFWVRERGAPKVTGVRYRGAGRAQVTTEVRAAIEGADRVVVCPANPVSSIGPMLAVPGLRGLLSGCDARVVALSPMVGGSPFSGPAGRLMKAKRAREDSVGVARLYRSFLNSILISRHDASMRAEIRSLGVDCHLTNTRMDGSLDEFRLAKELLRA